MIEWLKIAVFAVSIYLLVYFIMWLYDNNAKHDEEEREAFEQHRAERQAEFDRHAQEVAHRVLIETCETIYIGRWQND